MSEPTRIEWSEYARLSREGRIPLTEDEREYVLAKGAVRLEGPKTRKSGVQKVKDGVTGRTHFAAMLHDCVLLCESLEQACAEFAARVKQCVHGDWSICEERVGWPENGVMMEARRYHADRRWGFRRFYPTDDVDALGIEYLRERFIREMEHEFEKAIGTTGLPGSVTANLM